MKSVGVVRWRVAIAVVFLAGWLATDVAALAGTPQPLVLDINTLSYVQPYAFVVLSIGLGLFLVCRPINRRDHAHPERYTSTLDQVLETAEEKAAEEQK